MIYCAIIAFFLCFVFIFYISRHAWASIAWDKRVSMSVISRALGHHSEHTTRIYLASLDTSAVDCANRDILKALDVSGANL